MLSNLSTVGQLKKQMSCTKLCSIELRCGSMYPDTTSFFILANVKEYSIEFIFGFLHTGTFL